eukprot:CAMPEP_0119030786 /NCGR_PEP_ID=MMETSP1176-20130426/41207_1 /TAXON_ID=265551 /ORGANISM="Synedropsis recta cf, Strain CCMP1620" /LENGTH=313 /DNA_ID=CAMNT_0006987163 /DNA_START=105 /DNA_END=1046 /DNA_ORIENTATION=-
MTAATTTTATTIGVPPQAVQTTQTTQTTQTAGQEDASAMARKRRREILVSQRQPTITTSTITSTTATTTTSTATPVVVMIPDVTISAVAISDTDEPDPKRTKKPQMKYDPEVPMTKEEAAVWRREQRRKRNRESAAASRQRQRDRISELEDEVDDWKGQYDVLMQRLASMEEQTTTANKVTIDLIDSLPSLICSPSSFSSTTNTSTIQTTITLPSTAGQEQDSATVVSDSESSEEDHKMISRPAVKITGPPIDSMLLPVSLCPDPCLSGGGAMEKNLVVETTTAPEKEPVLPSLLKDEETEFDAFLLDAVQWL